MKTVRVLEAELFGSVRDIAASNDTIYPSFKSNRISRFLKDCALYDMRSKTWKEVKSAEQQTASERYLHKSLQDIIALIFLKLDTPVGEKRWVKDTYNVQMSHTEGDHVYEEMLPDGSRRQIRLKSSPDLSILGHGLHFSGSRSHPKEASYSHCLCPVDIKKATTFNPTLILVQAGIYARQCFIYQPFRRYVPVILIAGSNMHLHIYDRSGVLRSSAIDIHEDPATFVRIILGVSTVGSDTRYSPFDPRVRWKLNHEYPTITVKNNALKHNMQYKITGTKFFCKAIRGRATHCINAQAEIDGKVVAVLIKDAWRSCDRAAEWEIFKKIQGLDGVGQILAYDENENKTNTFRRHILATFCDEDDSEQPSERIFSRLVLQPYGRSIRHFNSELQLLEAFYDAVAGHMNLWKAGILHRDVSVDNILLGSEGATVGNRGILIDFDMAIDISRIHVVDSQYRTGTRAFQSVDVLSAVEYGKSAPPQDHLDDLESFLYVLGWICINYDGPGRCISSQYVDRWENSSDEICVSWKLHFLSVPTYRTTEHFDTPVFQNLLESLANFCYEGHRKRLMTLRNLKKGEKFPPLSQVYDSTKKSEDHGKFLAIIQVAIDAQKSVQSQCGLPNNSYDPLIRTNAECADPTNTSNPQPSPSANPTGTKRSNPASDDGGLGHLSKRQKIAATRRPARHFGKK